MNFIKSIKKSSKRYIELNDFIYLSLVTAFILGIVFLITGSDYIYGSSVDWLSQHSVLPDYFRQSFYDTGRLFPEFNLNLGAGQNAYNFSYYGFMNPIILISYLLPNVQMALYISISSIVVVLLSVYIFYFWLKSHNNMNRSTVYFITFLFACAGPLLYHSHKQVMFMDYIPFLLLALVGVDRLYKKDRKILLILSITCMFLTSYFFAVSGIVAISIYAIYKFFEYKENQELYYKLPAGKKPFWFFALRYGASSIIGILLSAVILLPSLAAILSGRGSSDGKSISLAKLFIPQFPNNEMFYTPYGMGVTAIAFLALACILILSKDFSKKFLCICILFVSAFPVGQYLLNGFLYIRGKALIPFVPLILLVTAFFVRDLLAKKYETGELALVTFGILVLIAISAYMHENPIYIAIVIDLIITFCFIAAYCQINKNYVFMLPTILIAIFCCYVGNASDTLVAKKDAAKYYDKSKNAAIAIALNGDDTFFRTSNITDSKFTNNIIYGKKYFSEGCYSSVFNKPYLNMCNYDLQLSNPTVNDISITSSNDVLFKTLMGVKYIASTTTAPAGYKAVCQAGNVKVYKSDNAYSLGFASKDTMSLDEYLSLSPEEKEIALLKYIVVDDDVNSSYHSMLKKVNLNMDLKLERTTDGYYHVDTMKGAKTFNVEIPDNLKDCIYIIKCNIKGYGINRSTIKINGIQNSLSGLNSAYPNKNFNFKFVVSDSADNNILNIRFPKGCSFEFSEFEIYKIDYDQVSALKNNITMMTDVAYENNMITGNITLDKDSYFTTTIPYDKGFSVYVDGQKIDYFMTDNAFLGFSLSSGHHIIKLVYHAPLIKVGKYTSLLGLVLFLIFCGKDFIRLWIQILNHFKRKKLTYSNGLSGNIVYQNDSLESNQ